VCLLFSGGVAANAAAAVGGRLEMLSNVKSQMSGWLGSGIPGLRKAEEPAAAADAAAADADSPASERSVKGSPGDPKEDGDDSSATGGADSEGPPTDDEADDKDGPPGSGEAPLIFPDLPDRAAFEPTPQRRPASFSFSEELTGSVEDVKILRRLLLNEANC